MIRRAARILIRLLLPALVVLAGFVAWAEFWPAPSRPRQDSCLPGVVRCVSASGRVLFHTDFRAGRRAHVVLLSRRSLTLPGVVSAEFPAQLTRTPPGLGFGDWVSLSGVQTTGSHHEQDIHLLGIATAKIRIRCGYYSDGNRCTRASGWPHAVMN